MLRDGSQEGENDRKIVERAKGEAWASGCEHHDRALDHQKGRTARGEDGWMVDMLGKQQTRWDDLGQGGGAERCWMGGTVCARARTG
jgi:hypothetical protein